MDSNGMVLLLQSLLIFFFFYFTFIKNFKLKKAQIDKCSKVMNKTVGGARCAGSAWSSVRQNIISDYYKD